MSVSSSVVKLTSVPPNIKAELEHVLELQRKAYLIDPVPDVDQRKQDLLNLKRMLSENQDAFIDALNKDYGNRSRHETQFAEIVTSLSVINDTIKHVKGWMKPQKRKVDLKMYPGGKNRVYPQPLGVVGVIVPWNFPVNLAFTGLASIFAAGNRAMVKMSENSIHTTRLMMELVDKYFPREKLAIFEETGEVGIQFSTLPFDHILFTGSSTTGRKVMEAAAKNLVPVTLELGGKCPAIIDRDYPMQKAVERIMFVKMFNAGQICTTVDYVFIPKGSEDEFIGLVQTYVAKHCPDINSVDYTSIIDERSYQRLNQALKEAQDKGARVINLKPDQSSAEGMRKLAPHLVLDCNDEVSFSTRETFGPILAVRPYESHDEVMRYITARDRPLAIYPFTLDNDLADMYIRRVMSGGVTVNDALFHVGQHDLPFGGVGASGMGHYHGYEGFLTFSKLRPVFYQPGFSSVRFLSPPYGKLATRMLNTFVKLNS